MTKRLKQYVSLTKDEHETLRQKANDEKTSMKAYCEKALSEYAETPYPLADEELTKRVMAYTDETLDKALSKQAKKADITKSQAARQIITKHMGS